MDPVTTRRLLLALATGIAPALVAQQPKVPPVTGSIASLVPPVPTPASFIADVPGVLSADAHSSVDARIRGLQDSGLGDIGIAILPSIGDFQPYEVGLAIYRTWRIGRVDAIGSARRDLGVLLLIVPKELAPDHKGQCWISTGTGAEGIITDAVSGAICRNDIIPHLRERDYGAALLAGVDAIAEHLRGDAGLSQSPDSAAQALPIAAGAPRRGSGWGRRLLSGLVAGLLAVVAARKWRRRRPRPCPKCGNRMTRLDESADDAALEPGQQVEERIKSVDYDVWQCTCGERLILPYKALFSRYHICKACHRRTARVDRVVLKQATTSSKGLARDTTTCKSCGATSTREVVLPRITASSSSGSGSGGSSSGGGSSFGGSGSSSGGGGGSSY